MRFWDIYSPALYLDHHEPGVSYNFSRLDRVFDFLVLHHMVPHIEVGNKPKKLMRSMTDDMMPARKGDSPFKNPETIACFFTALMRHLLRRYGAEKIDKWVLEYWMTEDDFIAMGDWNNYSKEMIDGYLKNFAVLADTVRGFGTEYKTGRRRFFTAVWQRTVCGADPALGGHRAAAVLYFNVYLPLCQKKFRYVSE